MKESIKNEKEEKLIIFKEMRKLFEEKNVEFMTEVTAMFLFSICPLVSEKINEDVEFIQKTIKELFNKYFENLTEVAKNERKTH